MTADRIAELEASRDQYKKWLDAAAQALLNKPEGDRWTYVPDTLAQEITQLRERAAAPHPDTARLDKLEAQGLVGAVLWRGVDDLGWLVVGQPTPKKTLREAIDALEGQNGT